MAFLEHCLDVHGPSASVLISKIDDSMLTIEHQGRLLRQAKFDWTFLGAGLGRLIGNLANTSVRQAGALADKEGMEERLRNDIAGLTRAVVEQRNEIGHLRHEIKELVNGMQMQIREASVESLRKIDEVEREVRNPWVDRGELGDVENFSRLLRDYPTHQFQWGVSYNTYGPEPVSVGHWNRGSRIVIQTMVPHGDKATSFRRGTAMFTCGTDDAENKNCFYHRYVNHLYAVEDTNGTAGHVHIWTRHF
jgi:hypothetical protein